MEKILTFIIRKNKLLLLLGSDTDAQFKESVLVCNNGWSRKRGYKFV